jgi:hypothetical protein
MGDESKCLLETNAKNKADSHPTLLLLLLLSRKSPRV